MLFEVRGEFKPPMEQIVTRFRAAERVVNEGQRVLLRGELGNRLLAMVREEAPKRTGQFAAGIGVRISEGGTGAVSLSVYTPSPLGRFITEGTRAHVITPRGNYPLRFVSRGGDVVYAWRVNHPGTRANPFIARAVNQWKPEANAALQRLGRAYVRTVTGAAAGQFF